MTKWPDGELRFTILVHDLVRALVDLRNICHEMAQPVLIVGAGLAGLSLARTLSSYRVPVRIFEASPEIRKYSYGITLLSWAYQPLVSTLRLGSVEELKAATATDAQVGGSGLISAQVKDAYTGATLLSDPPREPTAPQSYRCSRSKLGQLLAQGLDIEFGCKLDRVEQKASGVQLHFEGGKTAEGCLIVAADGIHSVVRKGLLPAVMPSVMPVMAINGRVSLPRESFLAEVAKYMNGSQTMLGAADRTAVHLAVSNHTDSNVLLSWTFTWQPEASDHKVSRRKSVDDACKIPEDFFDRLSELGPLAEPFRSILTPDAARRSAKYNWLIRSVQIPCSELLDSVDSGIVLVGDAAHAMPIVAGDGGNHALLDGMQL
ncbi:MAG: FAD binding domain-containing, partial [Trebouxia sp. A1-2]